jgi:hypothetical protein
VSHECPKCRHFIGDGQKHNCINDEVAHLRAELETARAEIEKLKTITHDNAPEVYLTPYENELLINEKILTKLAQNLRDALKLHQEGDLSDCDVEPLLAEADRVLGGEK